MENTFLTELRIEKVRHLRDITIPLSKTERKNLILTGKNGSGKTSVLRAIVNWLNFFVAVPWEVWNMPEDEREMYVKEHNAQIANRTGDFFQTGLSKLKANTGKWNSLCDKISDETPENAASYIATAVVSEVSEHVTFGCNLLLNRFNDLYKKIHSGQFVLAYYGDNRRLDINKVDHIEKVHLKKFYGINEKPAAELGKFLVDLESTKAFARAKGDSSRATQIENWFTRFENILRRIYNEPSLKLDFNIDTFQFSILIDGREPFDFNTMSMGYAAVFDIVADLMMRMESQRRYDLEGIVLIDEIETHLHVELQKQIVPILTELFPNIQFILTTHSPFILNSAPNAVVYDLEKRLLVEDGMENLSYEGIVEGYFEVDRFSQKLRKFFEEYKRLVTSDDLTDMDYARIAELEDYLDEVPDYLALDFAHEYSRLKAEFDS